MASKIVIEVDGGWIEAYQLKWLVQDIESQTHGKVVKFTRSDNTEFDLKAIEDEWSNG